MEATITWSGYLWVAELNGTRYADCNVRRLVNRLYNDGAEIVYEEYTTLTRRKTVWERVRHAAASMRRRK